jgi:hypothetical protein
VLEHARPGNRPLFGDVADDKHRGTGGLRKFTQPVRRLAHLRDRPGGRVHLRDVNGLDGVHHQQVRFERGDMLEDGVEVRLGDEVQLFERGMLRVDARGAHLDLPLRLLARNVQDLQPARHDHGDLQHQRGLADAGVAADEDDRTGDDPAAQHAGELSYRYGNPVFGIAADLAQPPRRRTSAQAAS